VDNSEDILTICKNIHSQDSISTLFNGYPYLPNATSAIDFHSLHVLLNDIVINNRKNIIEFGSGMSTFVIGRLIKLNKLEARLYSVDDDEQWYKVMQQKIDNEGLSEYIKLIYSPKQELSIPEFNHKQDWYSTTVLDEELGALSFDMVFADGPLACRKDIERSRFPAYYYMKNRLNKDSSVYLHDTDRQGEQSVIDDWGKIAGTKSQRFTKKMAGFIIGNSYTIEI
jgi:16S rRNA G966 N2-methylase RsmD